MNEIPAIWRPCRDFFFNLLEIKNGNIYVLWVEMRFYGFYHSLQGDLNISMALSHHHRTNETINNGAPGVHMCTCQAAFKDRADSKLFTIITKASSYMITTWRKGLNWQRERQKITSPPHYCFKEEFRKSCAQGLIESFFFLSAFIRSVLLVSRHGAA